MAETGLGDLRGRLPPARGVSEPASASDGLEDAGSRSSPDHGPRIRQWQNGTRRCEFGTRRGRAADAQRTTHQRARATARQWQDGTRTCELGTAPRTASPSAIESVGDSVLHAGPGSAGHDRAAPARSRTYSRSGSENPARVRREQPAPGKTGTEDSGGRGRVVAVPGFRGSARMVHDHEPAFGVALRECAPDCRTDAAGPCAKQPRPDRFPETVIAGEPRQVRSG